MAKWLQGLRAWWMGDLRTEETGTPPPESRDTGQPAVVEPRTESRGIRHEKTPKVSPFMKPNPPTIDHCTTGLFWHVCCGPAHDNRDDVSP
jgi:hypothetical protein